jgi:hypothetical protein
MVLTNQTEGGLFVSSSWSRYLGLSAAHAPFDSDGFDLAQPVSRTPATKSAWNRWNYITISRIEEFVVLF